ncbi:hypothetical protein [Leifsonia xyli]|uniref:hypothetical protein n=1 Tax=Leifsonia xyli TaxID=1575 RepID=UPI003D67B3C8
MDSGEETFVAFLIHSGEPTRDRSIELPNLESRPPVRVRVPVDGPDDDTMDVYELVAADDWPREVIYRYTGTEPRTT